MLYLRQVQVGAHDKPHMSAVGLLYDRVGENIHKLLRVHLVEHVVFRDKNKHLSRKVAEIALLESLQPGYGRLNGAQEHVSVAFVRADAFQERDRIVLLLISFVPEVLLDRFDKPYPQLVEFRIFYVNLH